MDIKKEKKKGFAIMFTHKAMPFWIGAFVLLFIVYLLLRGDESVLRVDKKSIIT